MSKKIIRLKESELKRYIRKIISEQNSPELPDGDNKGAYVKSGEGGGNDLESYKLSRKQKDAENENVRSCGQAMMDFSQIYTRISKFFVFYTRHPAFTWLIRRLIINKTIIFYNINHLINFIYVMIRNKL